MSNTAASAANRPVVKEGDWVCTESKCATINPIERKRCERCGRDRPRTKGPVGIEIGKEAAEKSKGLFSAEDWQCSKCGNVNWARRSTCNICNAPKVGELESRTGYGGGYMDRQDVEYVDRRSPDDDEFDEFGRKKKKLRTSIENIEGSNNGYAKEQAERRADDDDEEDDEEDDDADDDDLAKYDLSPIVKDAPKGAVTVAATPAVAATTPAEVKPKDVEKSRRSRSRSSRSSSSSSSSSRSRSGSSSGSGSSSSSGSSSGSSSSSSSSSSRSRSRSRDRKSRSHDRSKRNGRSSKDDARERRRGRHSRSRSKSRSRSQRSRSRSPRHRRR